MVILGMWKRGTKHTPKNIENVRSKLQPTTFELCPPGLQAEGSREHRCTSDGVQNAVGAAV